MTFPTIPTVAAGRILFANQANTTAARTFPSLSGLTKNAGDLLIAIVCTYQSTTNPQFSSWGGGFTEISDQGSATTLGMGVAWKISDGTETGTFTVTQATTITGHASMCLLSIPGAHASTAPEVGTIANGTASAADPGSFDPSGWASEDTLWIAVDGNGMTAATGSWTKVGAGTLTNYSGQANSNTTDSSTIGQTEIAVAFRQNAASSEDRGAVSTHDLSNARNSALIIAVRPSALATVTGTDTASQTITEGTTDLQANSTGSDTSALTITDASAVQAGFSATGDTGALTLSEVYPTIAVDLGTWVDGAAWNTDATQWDVSESLITGADTAAITFTEVSTNFLTSDRADTAAVTLTDVSTNFITSGVTDSSALTLTDVSSSALFSDRADTAAVTLTEVSTNLLRSDRTDTAAVTLTEVSSNLLSSTRTDTAAVTITDTSNVGVIVATSDTAAFTLTEGASAVQAALSRTDTAAVSIAEAVAIMAARTTADTAAVTITESASVAVLVVRTDTAALTLSDSAVVGVTLEAQDYISVEAYDTSALVITDWPDATPVLPSWTAEDASSGIWTKNTSTPTNNWS